MAKKPIEYVNWLKNIEEKSDELINLGPAKKREKRSRAMKAIVGKVKMSALFYVTYLKDPTSFAKEAVFQLAQFGLLKELDEFQKVFQAYKQIKRSINEELSQELYSELKKQWRNDPLVKKQVIAIEKNMRKKFKGILPVKEKVDHRPRDLFNDSLLIQCDLAFDKTVYRGRNGKIGEFVNAVYAEEKYPSDKKGSNRVRKRIDDILETAKGGTISERYNTLIQQWKKVTDLKRINVGRKIAIDKLSSKNP